MWNEIYDLLVEIGAKEDEREYFIRSMESGSREYRFRGKLGRGGKFHNFSRAPFCVTGYYEDMTEELENIIIETNRKLGRIYENQRTNKSKV